MLGYEPCSAADSSSLATGDSAIKWSSSAKGGCSAANSSSLATGDSAIKWGSSAKGGCSAANRSSLATGDSTIKWSSSAKGGCSAVNSSSLAAGDSGNLFTHSNMEQKHAHVSWETTGTAVMVTVLLLSLATAEVRGDISSSLEKMKQHEQHFEHGQGAHERQEKTTAALRMIMTPTIGVSGKC